LTNTKIKDLTRIHAKDFSDNGSSLIQGLLNRLYLSYDYNPFYDFKRPKQDLDNVKAREKLKMIHLLARYGAKWQPSDEHFAQARYSLRKMKPDYLLEFIWIMGGYQACSREAIEQLIKVPNIKRLISEKQDIVERLLCSFLEKM